MVEGSGGVEGGKTSDLAGNMDDGGGEEMSRVFF
jgi:hypothetical protein